MIPDSAAGLFFFLLCLAPGTLWEVLRSRHEPAVKETALLEISRLILVSITATAIAAVGLFALLTAISASRESSISTGIDVLIKELESSAWSSGFAVLATLLACAGTWLVARWKWASARGPISPGRVWHQAFVALKPTSGTSAQPVLTVELLDGTTWRGCLVSYDSDPEDADRNIALGQPLRRKRLSNEHFVEKSDVALVLLPESQVKSMQVAYPAAKR